jgi:hypothetical protein
MTLGMRVGLVSLFLTGPLTANALQPTIESASAVGGVLYIHGLNFGATKGTSTVTLGGVALTNFASWSKTDVAVTVSASPGSYLLALKTGGGTASLAVTVGAVGSAGPQGPMGGVGPQGPPGASAPACRGRPGGTCSTTTSLSCAYDKDCPNGESCTWAQSFARFLDNGNGTVTDRRTCLMWEKKTGTVSPYGPIRCTNASDCPDPHNVNISYSWSTGEPWSLDGSVVTVFLKQLNDGAFAGHTDWRLPTSAGPATLPTGSDPELESILWAQYPNCTINPCIDGIFGPTVAFSYWTASQLYIPAAIISAWTVPFFDGYVIDQGKASGIPARAVRGGPGVP